MLVSAAISPTTAPRQVVGAWVDERFTLIASPALPAELRDMLPRPKLRRWISTEVAGELVDAVAEEAVTLDDPPEPAGTSPDPDDDPLIAVRAARWPTVWSPETATCRACGGPAGADAARAGGAT